MLWPKYCITNVNKVLYYKSKQRCLWPKYCITKVNNDIMTNALYYKSKQTKVLYYKSKQRCYDQSIVLQM